MYTKEEIQEELDKQNWEKPELFWQNKKTSDGKYLLFRGHDVLDDTSTLHYEDKNGEKNSSCSRFSYIQSCNISLEV